ncbi:XRE family transcriptional regulator [uncultured Acinetobacter sp.]|uniref:helix-turn-helix domain-containing protein n=1 Tax=uncultured Acinetobacter sp. TaxID=165433 RepID=UPI00258FFBBE|nr:XRE family transcriptional regulator [uncultured Acinetobacter sp.]
MTNKALKFVGQNIRHFREKASLSQVELANLAGLSRRTVIALESNQMNISLAKLDAIASALKIDFVTLVSDHAHDLPKLTNVLAWKGSQPESYATLVGAMPSKHQTEMWVWCLGTGEKYEAEPDADGWHEMIWVLEGELTLQINDTAHILKANESLVFPSSTHYIYINSGLNTVKFIRNVAH